MALTEAINGALFPVREGTPRFFNAPHGTEVISGSAFQPKTGIAKFFSRHLSGDVSLGRIRDRFQMRAYHTTLATHVYWLAEEIPDDTGDRSPYNPSDLSDIVLADSTNKPF